MKRYFLLLFIVTAFSVKPLRAQSLVKEAMNNFAAYGKSQEIDKLEKARKLIDAAYATRRDSLSYRNNLTRALIYSTLAVVDSARKFTYKKDPVAETEFSVAKLRSPRFLDEHEPEITFIKKQLALAYLFRSNRALADFRYYEALNGYKKVDSLSPQSSGVTHNLALLSQRLGLKEDAAGYYEELIESSPAPDYYLTLSELYAELNEPSEMLRILQSGHEKFPRSRDILFKLLNTYTEKQDYPAVLTIIDDALALDGSDTDLTYLAGFSNEMTGNRLKAELYYKKTLAIDPNNYDGNYALGLLYLNSYLQNAHKEDQRLLAKQYLIKANEINPNDVKLLRALVILYKEAGDMLQLQRVNSKLNELILN
ncbi:MAG TPA: hypothetical protein VGE26_11090 [Sphingobacteriaceae bacterium]